MRVNSSNGQNNNMSVNCDMKEMHESSKLQKVEQNRDNNTAIKKAQKKSIEKHKGSQIDFKI